jgi:hypothetical protein
MSKIGAGQIGSRKIGGRQRCEAQHRVPQQCQSEIDRPSIQWAELPLALVEGDARQIWKRGRVLSAPSVPRIGTTTQNTDMRRDRRQR